MILRAGDLGAAVGDLQRRLFEVGYKLEQTNVYDQPTRDAVMQLQRRARLVVDGIYGPKTEAALRGKETGVLLKQQDLINAATALDCELPAIMAVNEVESAGSGFVRAGAPKILFERHVFWKQLRTHGLDPMNFMRKYPGIVSQVRGGYAGGTSEYTRLATARQICEPAAYESTSWGLFQVMGFHWGRLGYESVQEMVAAAQESEGKHLDMFVRFILTDTDLHKALRGRKWSTFARIYNGPAYRENLYDVKLARAYERYAAELEESVA